MKKRDETHGALLIVLAAMLIQTIIHIAIIVGA
jgi:hypothetical protein